MTKLLLKTISLYYEISLVTQNLFYQTLSLEENLQSEVFILLTEIIDHQLHRLFSSFVKLILFLEN